MNSFEISQNTHGFLARKNHGQSLGLARALNVRNVWKILLKHVAVEKEKRTKRYRLGQCGNADLNRQIGYKRANFVLTHVARVALVVKDNEAANPLDVSLLSKDA